MTTSYGDGSWELSITVVEVGAEKNLRVKGDLHVGGLMVRLVQELGEYFRSVSRSIQADFTVHVHVKSVALTLTALDMGT